MTKKIKIYLGLSFFLVGILFFNSAFAQQTLPAGGSSFETAVLLSPGKYQGGSLQEGQELYYSLQGKAGQQIKIKGVFQPASPLYGVGDTIALYDENKTELQSGFGDSLSVSWLPSSEKSTYNYYFKISDDTWDTQSFTLEFSLIDRYDAGSQSDAGDSFDKALTIAAGEHQGYLSYERYPGFGTDFKDYYKMSVSKGVTYEFKATPPAEDTILLQMFSLNRELLKEDYSSNAGSIVTLSLTPADNTNIFLVVSNSYEGASGDVSNYKLSIKSTVPLIKFYGCKDDICELVGEYLSLEDCQKATTKTCYQTENCDGKCGITPPPAGCIKDSDCPTGNICQDKKCVEPPPSPQKCAKDSDCSVGQVCKDGKCETVIPPVGCVKDSDCSAGNVCKDGKCVASPLPPPGPGLTEKLLSIFKNLNWLYIGIIAGLVVLAIIVLILLLRKKPEKKENIPPATFSGSKEADKPTVGYKHPCKFCDKLIPPNSTVCPYCGKINPLGPYRCPKCHEPVQKDWQACSHCGQNLRIVCPKCGKVTFFGDYCEDCGTRLLVTCPHCDQEQPPISDKCIKCNKPLKVE